MSILDSLRVIAFFSNCLLEEGDDQTRYLDVTCIRTARLQPDRVRASAVKIREMLDELPEAFREPGGAAFSAAMYDRSGDVWAAASEEGGDIEMLLMLGMALDLVQMYPPSNAGAEPFFQVTPV